MPAQRTPDAFAILLAAEHPHLNLLGISTVHGNASLDRVTENAIRVLTAIGRTDIPVYAGSQRPFMRPSVHAPDVHGQSGIDGTALLPEPATAYQRGNAIKAMYDAIMATPYQTCAIVATGALTNVALLFATFPDVVDHIKEISIMGGSFTEGNITKHAEFNIYVRNFPSFEPQFPKLPRKPRLTTCYSAARPESANAIFCNTELSHRITLITLDLSHQVLATADVLQTLLTLPNHVHSTDQVLKDGTTPLRRMFHDLLCFFASTYARIFNITEGPPCTIPLPWKWEYVKVLVDTHGVEVGRTRKLVPKEGETVVRAATAMDVPRFWEVLIGLVEVADKRAKVKWVEKRN
ncbi:inosine-uridine preferring nucleoside hydrolase-domain-containing protein [Kalaharituber pfeilii]|nr:inosine-uridine preferring nucleoside hydrolase-domain-containing protein [Kalaharituber pfeilii]